VHYVEVKTETGSGLVKMHAGGLPSTHVPQLQLGMLLRRSRSCGSRLMAVRMSRPIVVDMRRASPRGACCSICAVFVRQ